MEPLTALPLDLAVLADPSARGPAPLLRPPPADDVPQAPFELLLGLLTALPASGESWPPPGKELPVLPLDPEAVLEPGSELALEPSTTSVPAAFADTAVRARLNLVDAAPAFPAAAPPAPQPGSAGALPLPSGTAPVTSEPKPTSLVDPDPLAVLTAGGAEAPSTGAGAQDTAFAPKSAPARSWLETFTASDSRVQRPPAAAPIELPITAAPPLATATQPAANFAAVAVAATAVETPLVAQSGARRVEVPKLLAAVAASGESPSATAPDWLLPAGASGGASHGVAASPAPVAGQPVDTRLPSWHEAFASRVQYLVDTQVGEARIKLNPPELGAVDVKISLVDDKTYVHLTTATAAARDELAQSLPRLRELFTVSGLELGGASVHNGRDGHHGGHGSGAGGATPGAAPLLSLAAAVDDAPALAARRLPGRIDVFA